MAGPWSKKETSEFSKAASSSGSLKAAPATPAPAAKEIPLGEEADIENDVAKKQKANLADPALADRLAKVAAERRKFYGQ